MCRRVCVCVRVHVCVRLCARMCVCVYATVCVLPVGCYQCHACGNFDNLGSKSEMEYELELFEEIRQVEDGDDSISDRSEYEESDEPKKEVRQPSKRGRKKLSEFWK